MDTRCLNRKSCCIGDLKYRIILGLTVLFFTRLILACAIPKVGMGWDKNELIDYAPRIFLVKVASIDERIVRFKTLEMIKNDRKLIEFYSNGPHKINIGKWNPMNMSILFSRYSSDDFNFHKDSRFWKKNIGRSLFEGYGCAPSHGFKVGELYLLFPDAIGAMKAAEIIRSMKDRWYLYVKNRVKNVKMPIPKYD